ncbi:hypothetical protein [Parendozoicomonas sp. Alg238-R29]|uniref:hypothetical protein n=1 Tax=Parendozoicomonas sp. Alg238-R29 TaxID=2993446 RepID=UPI00248D87FD|nr:hypothetical protein [Parendozoicomonas sp. Alg238-R29]
MTNHFKQARALASLLGMEGLLQQEITTKKGPEERLEDASYLALKAENAQKKINALVVDDLSFEHTIENAIEKSEGKTENLVAILDTAIPGLSKAIENYLQTVYELNKTLFPKAAKKTTSRTSRNKRPPKTKQNYL